MTTLDVLIDLTDADLDLNPEELEAYSLQLTQELKSELADDAALVRAPEPPEGSRAGAAAFLGLLKAQVNLENIKALLNWLGERLNGKTLELEYGDVKLKYRTPQQLEEQLMALEKISELKIRVVSEAVNSEANRG
jgi:hypothetical protein